VKSVSINRFDIDNNIAYLIQQITNDSTQEILGYFYGIAIFVGEDIAKSSRASWLSKDIILYYKETPIPYRLQISGGSPKESVRMNISIGFPKSMIHQNVTGLMDKIVESGLGLTEEDNMPKFNRPELKTPRCLKSVRIAQNEQRSKTNPS
jgi:hypothetical protein